MQQRMKRGAKRALAMAVTVCLLVMASACTEPKLAADSFDDFCTRVIREMVGEDYVTIHFFFDDPDALGLGDVAPTFGRYTAEVDEEEAERSAAMIRGRRSVPMCGCASYRIDSSAPWKRNTSSARR